MATKKTAAKKPAAEEAPAVEKKKAKREKGQRPFNGARRANIVIRAFDRVKGKFPMTKTNALEYTRFAAIARAEAERTAAEAMTLLGHSTVRIDVEMSSSSAKPDKDED